MTQIVYSIIYIFGSIIFLFLVLLTGLLILPTKLILETLKDSRDLVQLITFQCLGDFLEGIFELSTAKRSFTLRVLGSSIWGADLEREEGEPHDRTDRSAVLWDLDLLCTFLRSVQRLLQEILKTVSFEEFFCYLKVDLPDPAQTGIVFGTFCVVKGMFRSAFPEKKVNMTMEPNWGRTRFDVSARGILHFRLIRWIIPLIRFFLNGSVRKFLRLMKKEGVEL